jgi:N-acetyl-anhydromuramyl-L-alanine amidase AmpD
MESWVLLNGSRIWAWLILPLLLINLGGNLVTGSVSPVNSHTASSIKQVFMQVSTDTGVPVSLLEALCYMEGRLSNHDGAPSIDNGYGCMHLVKNRRSDTLDRAATLLGVDVQALKTDLATNIRGGAVLLADDARQLSAHASLPTALSDWYGAVALYSNAVTRGTALMYANALYIILNKGFSATTDTGELITLSPQAVTPNRATAAQVQGTAHLPAACTRDGKTDYAGAINCILDPSTYDCHRVANMAPCTYEGGETPRKALVKFIAIQTIDGTVQDALNTLQDPDSATSVHYLVDSDGTVYQILPEHDIAYNLNNAWYNQHSIGIEHAGFTASGYRWYNATQYLASAKLTAYLLKKYNLPLDHDHVIGHSIVPAPTLPTNPNRVDPGPYWLWDYYFALVHQQGIPFTTEKTSDHIVTFHPSMSMQPLGKNGAETADNFAFFYLYTSANSASASIAPSENPSDQTDVTNNVEADVGYYYKTEVVDTANPHNRMYQIWYGSEIQAGDATSNHFAHGQYLWLAAPADAAVDGQGTLITLNLSGATAAKVYGAPISNDFYQIGDAPNGALFVSAFSVAEDDTSTIWYEIHYNHRQAWVPATEVTRLPGEGV